MTDYSSERGDPGGAQYGQNSLLFDAYYLKLLVPRLGCPLRISTALSGAAGCVDLTYGMESFATFLDSADDGSCYIPLTVNYNGTGTIAAPA